MKHKEEQVVLCLPSQSSNITVIALTEFGVMLMKAVIALWLSLSVAFACSCFPQSANDAFCQADWVSRVKVNCFHNPHNDETGMYDVIYAITHIRIYKKPGSVSTLSSLVYTPSNGATCGLYMEVGREYLLSGGAAAFHSSRLTHMQEIAGTRQPDGSPHVYLCGQVTDSGFGGVSEWSNVSPALRANLTTFQC
ncbi:tissue inhibitor of metalloproteinase [Ancylostoma ceylanicum]|uniref:Tissue inhibitor of metalloproteinase n=1 Tax=Ancylostoma ceylanicum TaxID=53326 RepID=A0A0D6LH70_9BILA|nr:tissue inhibitor of metalloproteinase [Ancylostoma ceylanicum]